MARTTARTPFQLEADALKAAILRGEALDQIVSAGIVTRCTNTRGAIRHRWDTWNAVEMIFLADLDASDKENPTNLWGSEWGGQLIMGLAISYRNPPAGHSTQQRVRKRLEAGTAKKREAAMKAFQAANAEASEDESDAGHRANESPFLPSPEDESHTGARENLYCRKTGANAKRGLTQRLEIGAVRSPKKPVDPPKPEIDYGTEYEPASTNPEPIPQQPLQANSSRSTTEKEVLPMLVTSTT
ncbi:MAG: hypothetical protein Q9208_002802 [Pyrenodesmia sp. 3 TL-2023]